MSSYYKLVIIMSL